MYDSTTIDIPEHDIELTCLDQIPNHPDTHLRRPYTRDKPLDVNPIKPTLAQWKQTHTSSRHPLLSEQQDDQAGSRQRLRELWYERQKAPDPDWQQPLRDHLTKGMLPEGEFQAGALHHKWKIWADYINLAGIDQEQVELELSMLRDGIRLEWCHPLDPHKLQEPRHEKRVKGVIGQLNRAGMSQREATEMLNRTELTSVVLENELDHASADDFAREQIIQNVKCGALVPWPFHGTRPFLVLPLAVVQNSEGKMRLIVDGRLLNLRLKRLLFKYETATDAMRMFSDMDWVWTLDVRAGYHHALLHPEDWTYVGLCFEGRWFVHAALPFGLSQAPEKFTRLMQLSFKPLIQLGGAITSMVDDSAGTAADLPTAARDMGTLVEILSLLGWTLNGEKCMREPGKCAGYLGFQFDFLQRRVYVPERKLERIVMEMSQLRQTWELKRYRSVVGKLAAATLALPFSPLLTRALALERDCANGLLEPALHQDLLDFLLSDIRSFNGRPWDATIRPALTMVVDTSESATGAHIVGSSWQAHLPLSKAEIQRKKANQFSSTEGEVLGILRALQEGIRSGTIPTDGSGAVHVVCDNQGAVSAVSTLRGGRAIFPTVARIHRLALERKVILSVSWARRNTLQVQLADERSKLQDSSDWRLSRKFLDDQVRMQAGSLVTKGWYPPHIDMFASSRAHQVDKYFSLNWDGGCIGQNALVQRWGEWPAEISINDELRQSSPSQPVLFMFPPASLLPLVLMKIKAEKATVWLVCSRYLRPIDEQFLQNLPVQARFPLRCRQVAHIVKPTIVNPASLSGERWCTPLQALCIRWP